MYHDRLKPSHRLVVAETSAQAKGSAVLPGLHAPVEKPETRGRYQIEEDHQLHLLFTEGPGIFRLATLTVTEMITAPLTIGTRPQDVQATSLGVQMAAPHIYLEAATTTIREQGLLGAMNATAVLHRLADGLHLRAGTDTAHIDNGQYPHSLVQMATGVTMAAGTVSPGGTDLRLGTAAAPPETT